METKLRIAVQSKGRLYDETMELLTEAGVKLNAVKRTLLVPSRNFPVELLYLRDDDIPDSVASGIADIGIVGLNEVLEKEKAVETIKELAKKYPVCIVSNCEAGYIELVCDKLGIKDCIKDGECPGYSGLGKGDNIKLVMDRNGFKDIVYVGDTQGDYEATRKAGVPFVYCKYGFGNPEKYDYKIEKLPEFEDTAKVVGSAAVLYGFCSAVTHKGKELKIKLPVYIFKNGVTVVPCYGAGLWGPIWGYIGIKGDLTITKAYFGHKGETPGLGAKITDMPEVFADKFTGKTITAEILVAKNVTGENDVNAISGATITSTAAGVMVNQWLGFYQGYFGAEEQPCCADCQECGDACCDEAEQCTEACCQTAETAEVSNN